MYESNRLHERLKNATEQLKGRLKQYVNTFSQSDFFTFSGVEERKKQYISAYNSLSLDMPLLVAEIEQIFSELVGILIEADREADKELSEQLNGIFLAHSEFEERLAELVEISEKELSAPAPSPTALSNAAIRLLGTLERF